jgi:molybdate transport system substrate-binding protein
MWLKSAEIRRDLGNGASWSAAVVCARLLSMVVVLLGANAAVAETINVSAAVSTKEAVTDIAKAFEAETHDHVDLTFGSSGQLAAQIRNGAPVDLFISAANKEVDDLSKAGLVDDATRRIVAGNELVLIVPADSKTSSSSFEQLKDPAFNRVAIGEPKTVPAGQYAMQVLKTLNLENDLSPRLIFGVNVRQVLAYVERGEVSAGVVYATDALQAGPKVKVVATAKPSLHEPVLNPAVVVKASTNKPLALQFLHYLLSDKGQAALAAHGFTRAADAAPDIPTTAPAGK